VGDSREGTVFIAEELATGEPYLFTGRFSAHWQSGRDTSHRDGPELVSIEEALAWGREQADRVLIRLVDSEYYSAGRERVRDLEPWPEGSMIEPRREPGFEHLDLVADEPVPWQVRLPRWISRKRTEADVERIRTALATDPAVSHVSIEVERGERVDAIARFVVQARSHPDALQTAIEVDGRLGERVPYPIDELPDSAGGAFVMYTGWNPYDDIRPA
jgi:hypothetical protein